MPKIQWERLPREKWAHLRERAKERHISEVDLFELAEWKAQDPDVPDGDWYKDLDRKSTRLNSSHLVISYAVFCLKKKNKNTKHHWTRPSARPLWLRSRERRAA